MPSQSSSVPKICEDGNLNALLDAMSDGLLYIDAAGAVSLVGRKVEDYFGIPSAELIGKPINDFAERLAKCFVEFMTYHEVFGYPMHDLEHEFLRDIELSAPQHRFIQVTSAPVSVGGQYAGRLWTLRDVTSEREITELKIQFGGARGADELKSKFLTVISHQLRTPLNSVRWNTETLLSGDVAGVSPEMREILQEVYKAVVNSLSIVDDMLLAVDIEQRTIRLEKGEADLADILSKVVHEHSRSAALKSVELILMPPKDLPKLFVDAARIETAISRLVSNAIRYTPSGGTVSLTASADKSGVSVTVRDTGIGISEEDRPKIFQRFYRAKKAIELFPDASGLGLYITKFIIDAHDGKISFDSEEGRGSAFTIVLPRRVGTK